MRSSARISLSVMDLSSRTSPSFWLSAIYKNVLQDGLYSILKDSLVFRTRILIDVITDLSSVLSVIKSCVGDIRTALTVFPMPTTYFIVVEADIVVQILL